MNAETAVAGVGMAVVLSATVACGAAGALGQAQTVNPAGADKGGLASTLDEPLAVGGEVRPTFRSTMAGAAAPPTHFVSARPDVLEVRDGLLVGRSPGMSAVLVAMDDSTVLDFVHVWVRSADRLEVHSIDMAGGDLGPITEPVELVPGDSLRLVPHAYAASEQLAGVATSGWTVEPPIAVVLREGLPNRVRIVARTPGSADVKVTMLGATSHLKLTVVQ
jgi:hypothetical protein